MPDLQTTIGTISEQDLNALFGDEPIKNIDESNVFLGKSNVQITKDDKSNVIKVGQDSQNIPHIDVDNLDSLNAKKEEQKQDGQQQDIKGEQKEEKKEETTVGNIEVIRNTAKYLISKGHWKDFEGSEEALESLTEEGYAELATKQYEAMKEEVHEEVVARTGDYGKAIIEYVENGGNPDEVLDIFKEQKVVEAISIETEDGQKELITKFYTEVYDWSPEKAKKYINNLISQDELGTEAKEVETKYNEFFQNELKNRQLQQQATFKQEQEKQKAFVQTINTKLSERKDFTEKDRKLIQEALFRYDYTLPDGTKVNKFYQTFAEKQKNPDEYLDLVHFMMDKEGYNKRVKTKEETTKVDKKWSFIKSNAAVDKTKGSRHEEVSEDKNKTTPFNWGVLNK